VPVIPSGLRPVALWPNKAAGSPWATSSSLWLLSHYLFSVTHLQLKCAENCISPSLLSHKERTTETQRREREREREGERGNTLPSSRTAVVHRVSPWVRAAVNYNFLNIERDERKLCWSLWRHSLWTEIYFWSPCISTVQIQFVCHGVSLSICIGFHGNDIALGNPTPNNSRVLPVLVLFPVCVLISVALLLFNYDWHL